MRWAEFCQQWAMIGVALLLAHNLLVIAIASSDEAKRSAATEVANSVMAVLIVAQKTGRSFPW